MGDDRFEKFSEEYQKGKYNSKNKTNHRQLPVKKNLESVNTQEIEHAVDHAIAFLTDAFSNREHILFGWEFTDEHG